MTDYIVLQTTTAGDRLLKKGETVRGEDLQGWGANSAKMVASGFIEEKISPPAPPKPAPQPELDPTPAPATVLKP